MPHELCYISKKRIPKQIEILQLSFIGHEWKFLIDTGKLFRFNKHTRQV